MSKRTLIGAAAFSAALAGGGVAGAMLGTPGVSGAQDDTTSTTTATEDDDAARPHRPHPRLKAFQAAAEALGMTPAELRAELEAGKSMAEVAEEQGVDKQAVVDAIVADGTERLEKAIEQLPTRAAEVVEREGLPDRPGRGGHGPRRNDDTEDAPADDAD